MSFGSFKKKKAKSRKGQHGNTSLVRDLMKKLVLFKQTSLHMPGLGPLFTFTEPAFQSGDHSHAPLSDQEENDASAFNQTKPLIQPRFLPLQDDRVRVGPTPIVSVDEEIRRLKTASVHENILKSEEDYVIRGITPNESGLASAYYYTVGLAAKKSPEFLVSGDLHPNIAVAIIKQYLDLEQVKDNPWFTGLLDNIYVNGHGKALPIYVNRLKRELAEQFMFRDMNNLYPEVEPVLYQIVMPNLDGYFPWDGEQYEAKYHPERQEVFACEAGVDASSNHN